MPWTGLLFNSFISTMSQRPEVSFIRKVLAIVWKDVLTEWRSREMFSAMAVFALLIVLIFNFAFELRVDSARQVAPGVLWVAITFAGMLGLSRSFILEKDKGSLEGLLLAPVDRSAIYFGKMLSNILFMLAAEVVVLPVFAIFFNLSPGTLPGLAGVMALGTIGFAGSGTLFSAMAVHTRAREIMLPVLLFPVFIPAMLAAVRSTAGLLDGRPLAEFAHWLNLLAVFDVVLIAVAFMTFDYVVEE
jgi:heme exporter protein B